MPGERENEFPGADALAELLQDEEFKVGLVVDDQDLMGHSGRLISVGNHIGRSFYKCFYLQYV